MLLCKFFLLYHRSGEFEKRGIQRIILPETDRCYILMNENRLERV